MTVLTCPDTWTSGKEPGISTAASSLGAMVNRPIAMAAAAAAKLLPGNPGSSTGSSFVYFHSYVYSTLISFRLCALTPISYIRPLPPGQDGTSSVPALRLNPHRIVPYNNPLPPGSCPHPKTGPDIPVLPSTKASWAYPCWAYNFCRCREEVYIHSCPVPPLPDSSRPVQPHFHRGPQAGPG